MRAVPTLKPKHFDGRTNMVDGGLHFKASFTVDDWLEANPWLGGTFSEEGRLRRIAAKRAPGRVELHPTSISPKELVEICQKSQNKLRKRERINVAYGMPDSFGQQWEEDHETKKFGLWKKSEGQSLVLVAFDSAGKAVGYSSFTARCTAPVDRSDDHEVRFQMVMIYVLPERRGEGFGLDLSVATGIICRDIFLAYYRAVPAGAKVVPHIYAEYESEGGEDITMHVRDELDVAVDMLRESRKHRRSVVLSHTQLDGGW